MWETLANHLEMLPVGQFPAHGKSQYKSSDAANSEASLLGLKRSSDDPVDGRNYPDRSPIMGTKKGIAKKEATKRRNLR
jgi:hypothetical protein